MTTSTSILARCRPWSLGDGPAAVAIDVGGTTVKAGLIDTGGRMIDATIRDAPEPGDGAADELVLLIDEVVEAFRRTHRRIRVEAVSAVIPGIVDDDRGIGVYSTNLGWRDADFASMLGRRYDLPVRVSHDVRAAGRSEFSLLTPETDALMITIGTGISAALRLGGAMVTGGGYAGEIGMLPVTVRDGAAPEPVERIASAAAIARRYSERTGFDVQGSIDVVQARDAGDAAALEIWADAVEALAQVCLQATALLTPSVIIFGGGLAETADLHSDVASALSERISYLPQPEVRAARLGYVAGLLGAGLLTREPGAALRSGEPQAH
ncbi:ROK family protein [Nocardiopsis tropica]|uniref:ROK family protein n=1 Tax=Tsukamurella strandjordii TaxID=147577 RepID=UPI0031DD4EB9